MSPWQLVIMESSFSQVIRVTLLVFISDLTYTLFQRKGVTEMGPTSSSIEQCEFYCCSNPFLPSQPFKYIYIYIWDHDKKQELSRKDHQS